MKKLFILCLCLINQLIYAQVGTTSVNPIVVSVGTTSITNQRPDSLEKWYKLTFTEQNFAINTKLATQGDSLLLYESEVFIYDTLNNLLDYQIDTLRQDSSLFHNFNNVPVGSIIYLKYKFDPSKCNYCSGVTVFSISLSSYTLSTCFVTSPYCDLVLNGDFEAHSVPCFALGLNLYGNPYSACNWTKPNSCISTQTVGTPDYYNSCDFWNYNSAYYNFYTTPHSGNGCAGICVTTMYSPPPYTLNSREYLQEQLSSSMVAGNVYELNIWLKSANLYYFSSDLHMVLSNSFFCQSSPFTVISYTGQLVPLATPVVTNTSTWQLHTYTFVASQNWDKITIGNFASGSPPGNVITNANCVPTNSISYNGPYAPPSSYIYIDDISIKRIKNYTVSFNPNQCPGYSTTITVSGPSSNTYTLQPGNLTGTSNIVTPTATTIYTISANGTGCPLYSSTFQVNVIPSYSGSSTFTLPSITCQYQTLSLNSMATPGGGTFTGVGVTNSGSNYYFNANQNLSPGTYDIVYTFTTGTTCIQTFTLSARTVIATTVALTAQASNYAICTNLSQSNTTLSVSTSYTGSLTYTWQPGSNSGSSLTVSPSVSTIYTVSTLLQSCINSTTLAITVNSSCCTQTITAFNGNVFPSGWPTYLSSRVFNNDVTVTPGNVVYLTSAEYLFAPNVKIIVEPGGRLEIEGAHLYACGTDMWQGIVLKDGAQLWTYTNGVHDNLIEDAIIAVDASNQQTTTIVPPDTVIKITRTTFNKNYIGVKLSNYKVNSSAYPFGIYKSVFTSRTLTYSPTSWPSTSSSSGLRAASSSTDGLTTPYLLQSASITTLLPPYNSQSAHKGIELNSVGTSSSSTYYNIQIGRTVSTDDYNIFDGLGQGIESINSNVLSLNNVFQNTQQYLIDPPGPPPPYMFGGNGIRHLITNDFNAQLNLTANSNNPSFGNRFYDCHYAVNCDKVTTFDCKYATFRSTQSNTTTAFGSGNTGIVLRTNRIYYTIQHNSFANINTPINIPLSIYTYTYPVSGAGIYAGSLDISNNYIGAQINSTATIANEYVNRSINISMPIINPITTATGANFIVLSNTLSNVYRGVEINGVSKSNFMATAINNTITLVDDPAAAVSQCAIKLVNNTMDAAMTNTLSSATYTNSYVSLLFGSYNNQATITCNNLSNSYQGFVIDNQNPSAVWRGNTIQTHTYGLTLSNNGFMGTQGSSGNPIDNAWNGSWGSGANETNVVSSFASSSKLFLQATSPWNPLNNAGPAGQNYNTAGCLNTTSGSYSCATVSSSTVSTNLIMPLDSVFDDNYIYIANTNAYRLLKSNPTIMNSDPTFTAFVDGFRSSSIELFNQVEDTLIDGDFAAAYELNSTISPTNGVEYYSQLFYNLYHDYLTDNFSTDDSLYLFYMSQACPGYYGHSIYQARALYNYIYTTAYDFPEYCGGGGGLGRTPEAYLPKVVKRPMDVNLFPNPANNFVTLVSKNPAEYLTIKITDVNGRILVNRKVQTSDYKTNLDLDLFNGIYFVTIINSANEKQVKKLVIAK